MGGTLKGPEIFIGLRKADGQFGYVSEGVDLPEFYELIRHKDNGKRVLVDYAPVVDVLLRLHNQRSDDDLVKMYNEMYNFWQESKSYTKESLKEAKRLTLCEKADALITELQIKLQKTEISFKVHQDLAATSCGLKRDCDIYIDALLCYIHSKASLEIESFKNDFILTGYADFLLNMLERLYRRVIHGNQSGLYKDSFLKCMAFEQPDQLQGYLRLEYDQESADSFKLRVLQEAIPGDQHINVGDNWIHVRDIKIQYDIFSAEHINAAHALRDLVHKARSLKKLIELLKEGGIEWDESEEALRSVSEAIGMDENLRARLSLPKGL
jgi:mRNA-degrading endonuclease YafQ of YafQ-DinJ toxin-antitoxin module